MAVNNIVKRIQNIMRSDSGVDGDAQRIAQMTWLFFLKVYDTQEETWEYKAFKEKREYVSILPEPLRWRNWAIDEKDGKTMTGEELLTFVNNVLFPVIKGQDAEYKGETIKGIVVTAETPRSKSIVQETFADLNQYMKDGTYLRQVINIVNEIEFDDAQDRHMFGDIYETILKDLQSAGHAGEFYTPRALTDFIVMMLDPKLGEIFGDFTSGTGGFLTSALNYMAPQVKSASDNDKLQHAVVGQEWKPLPYLLSITNLLLHDIESPNIRHCDSLGTNVSDFKESDKVDVIGMNPPYGGSTGTSVQSNFPSAYRSSETADLFIALIMYRLKAGGRCGVIIPDGFLFGTDGAKLALKEALLRKFNLHTIIRLPGSIFAPYTSIATNILFFNNEAAEGASEGFKTKETWFYRLDMPEGYKHFSKTKPMKLEHTQPIQDWWKNRTEIINKDTGEEKSRCFSAQQLLDLGLNFDQCKFPKEEEEVLRPEELLKKYHEMKDTLNEEIENIVLNFEGMLKNEAPKDIPLSIKNPCNVLSELISNIPERLKKSILQEAIEGRLVPQDPNDEPASALLDKIRAEKKRLLKEGKLKKKDLIETPINEDEIPFDIPEGWMWCRLGEISTYAHTKKKINASKADPKLWGLDLEDIEKGGRLLYVKTVGERKAIGDKTCFAEGDILYSKLRPYLLKILIAPNEGICTPEIIPFTCYGNICKEYIVNLLKSAYVDDYINSATFGIKMPRVATETMTSLLIPLPPLAEQHRIVEKLEQLLHEIDKLKNNL